MSFLSRMLSGHQPQERPDYSLAHDVLDWASQPYHAKFISWLEEQILKPAPTGVDALEHAIKTEAYKEIRARLKQIVSLSESAVQNEREEHNIATER